MTDPTESTSTTTQPEIQAPNVAVSVCNPFLTQTDPASIRTFFRKYDQYCRTVKSRAKQLNVNAEGSSTTTTETILLMELKYCVDAQYFTSCIDLGFITGVTSFEDMTDTQLRKYLDDKAEESKDALTLDGLEELVRKKLKMNMDNRNAKSRMQGLFASYHSLLSQNGVKWIIDENQKLTVTHVLSAVRPQSLRERLESNLSFSQHALKKDFKEFLKHAVKLSEAFQTVDTGPKEHPKKPDDNRSGNPGGKQPGKDDK